MCFTTFWRRDVTCPVLAPTINYDTERVLNSTFSELNVSRYLSFLLCFVALNVAIAGELDPRQQQWIKKYEKQANVPKADAQLVNTDKEPALAEGFSSLFNGKDLSGWTAKGGTCKFEVVDGQIMGSVVPGSSSTYLSTEKAHYEDFVFTCEMKWLEDGNSGVMFRAKTKPNPKAKEGQNNAETVYGPQAEMEGFSQERHWSGGIYGQSCGGYFYPLWLKEHESARAALKEGEWNRVTVSCKGNTVKTWINGVPAAHWEDDGSYPRGFFGLQIHKGSTGKVLWRDLRVKEL